MPPPEPVTIATLPSKRMPAPSRRTRVIDNVFDSRSRRQCGRPDPIGVAMETMTGGRALARQLAREGVRDIFGLPGDQIMYALDGLYDEPSIRFVTTRHEQATTFMADGYAR